MESRFNPSHNRILRIAYMYRHRYRHRITGEEVIGPNRPQELGGGILADDMGMGKTFSTLALIARTIADATEWSSEPSKAGTRKSRATLIIAPSLRKWVFWRTHAYYTKSY